MTDQVAGIGTGGGVAFGKNPTPPTTQSGPTPAQQALRRLQGQGNGLDFAAMTQGAGVGQLQEPLPPLDFQWTWESPSKLQRGFKLTINSARGGLEMQRGRVEAAHSRSAQSTLASDVRDEIILNFETTKQTNLQAVFTNYNLIHTRFQDREIMAPYLGDGAGVSLYAETSSSDPTVVRVYTFAAGVYIYSLGQAIIHGIEHLVILTSSGAYFVSNLSPFTIQAGSRFFQVVTDAAPPADSGVGTGDRMAADHSAGFGHNPDIVSGVGGSVLNTTWGGGETTESFTGLAMIQSPIPGNPLILRTSTAVLLVPVEASDDNSNFYTQNASKILASVGLGAVQAIGFQRVGNLPPAAYWWETTSGGPASNGSFVSRLTSTDAYGYSYQVHHLSLPRILGASGNSRRAGIALTSGDEVVFWNGREEPLGIFADEPPLEGYRLFCVGLYHSEAGELFAMVNELPYAIGTTAEGRIRGQLRRFDFDLNKWFAVSDWITLTAAGRIRWNTGVPIPVATLPAGPYGYMSAYGAPDLPLGAVTRALHSYAVQARYDASLAQTVPQSSSYDLTWYHKFQAPPGQNPYSLRGGDRDFTASGVNRWPAMIFPSGYEYADKYIDGLEWGGQDTGGTASKITIRIGEGGRMDETAPGPIGRSFTSPVNHMSRRQDWARNATSLLFPQIEIEITVGDDTSLTAQGLPFTVYGHVDLPELLPFAQWRETGRAAG